MVRAGVAEGRIAEDGREILVGGRLVVEAPRGLDGHARIERVLKREPRLEEQIHVEEPDARVIALDRSATVHAHEIRIDAGARNDVQRILAERGDVRFRKGSEAPRCDLPVVSVDLIGRRLAENTHVALSCRRGDRPGSAELSAIELAIEPERRRHPLGGPAPVR